MYRIQTLNAISSVIYDELDDQYQVSKEETHPDAYLIRSANLHDQELPEGLLAIGRAGAGTNNIPVELCTEKGIVVFNTPGANANAVKELVIASLFLASRRVIEGIEWAKTLKGQGDEIGKLVEKSKNQFVGPEVKGKRLGVIGLGAIGVMVANAAHAIGMEVLGYDPFISIDAAWHLSRAVKHESSLEALLANSDYITIHVPLNAKTKDLINAENLARANQGIRILNFARGGIINEEDLVKALEEKQVGRYITDFPSEALIGLPNVICIPHLGASTPESEDNCARMAAAQVRDYLENGNIRNSVNFPDCSLPGTGAPRLAVLHKNEPNMVGQITSILAARGININNMNNRSRGQTAYTLIDLDNGSDDGLVEAMGNIQGVIGARLMPAKR